MAEQVLTVITAQKSKTTLVIDVTKRRSHAFPLKSTELPAEDGPDFSDQLRQMPNTLTLECVVSELEPDGAPGNVDAAHAFLKGLWENRELCTIATDLELYTDMAMQKYPFDETPDTGQALKFTLDFKKLFIKSTQKSIRQVAQGQRKKNGKTDPAPLKDPAITSVTDKLDNLTGGLFRGALQGLGFKKGGG